MGHFLAIMVLCLLVVTLTCYGSDNEYNSSNNDLNNTVSTYYQSTLLKPFQWSYLRVVLPSRFESLTIELNTDIQLDQKSIRKKGAERLPIICFREGGPPLPDVSYSKQAFKDLVKVYTPESKEVQRIKSCYFLQGNMTFTFTNEEVTDDVLYMGVFYGIGPARTQSKMINRGKPYIFNAIATVEACNESGFWGKSCNRTIEELQCVPNSNKLEKTTISCRSKVKSCHHHPSMIPKLYFRHLDTFSEELKLSTEGITTTRTDQMLLMCYARNGAIPTENLFDYSIDISKKNLIVKQPKLGTWYFYIVPKRTNRVKDSIRSVCYSLGLKVVRCIEGKAGPKCLWPIIHLKAKDTNIFGVNETKLSKTGERKGDQWSYYTMNVSPPDKSSRNIRVVLTSNVIADYEVYARVKGYPSIEQWDYYCANQTSNSDNGSSFFKLYESNDGVIFDILYAQEGNWSFGLRRRSSKANYSRFGNLMSISLEPCPAAPAECSGFGTCVDDSAIKSGSICQCDRFHGGFDCSVELVSKDKQKLWVTLLVGSNAAAILPAMCALWKKSYAELVVYLSSGIASALYHACDTEKKCSLQYSTLQFMDFWLSFVAVGSTFVYMTSISESMKRAILSVVWIITAFMAIDDATSSRNIACVVLIGVGCLLIALLIESVTKYRSFSSISCRPRIIISWFISLLKKLYRRFRWAFIVAGFIAVSLAAISWNMENYANYWIWHSIWHIAMYSGAALFVCSKVKVESNPSKPIVNNDFSNDTGCIA